MPGILLNALLLIAAGGIGLGAGWFIWARKNAVSETADVGQTQIESDRKQLKAREDQASDVIQRVRELVDSIGFEVEEHNEKVNAANDQLLARKGQVKEVVEAVELILEANSELRNQLSDAEMKLETQSELIASHVKEARTDALTRLSNRRAFDAEIAEATAEMESKRQPSTVILYDVDRFKNLNDEHGHVAGDNVLRQVAKALRRATRLQGRVFRYGGEEFAIVVRGHKPEETFKLCEQARLSIKSHAAEINGKVIGVSASAGLAAVSLQDTHEVWIENADKALYEAKRNGRDCAYWFHNNKCKPVPELVSIDEIGEDELEQTVEEQVDSAWRVDFSSREQFVDDVFRRVSANRRNGGKDSLLLVSVDGLAEHFTENGAKLQELLLRATAQFLKASVRDMDHIGVFETSVFAIWLPTASLDNSAKIGERIRVAIAKCKVPFNDKMLKFTVSVGIAQNMLDDTVDSIMERCDLARSYANQRGGNCCYVANDSSFVDARMMPESPKSV